jgi:WD40 repeat protein
MSTIVEEVTGIPRNFLLKPTKLYTASVAQRMSWAAQRNTKRAEDRAYCLLGIFNVVMPMIYGEGGHQAFYRLQEEIMKTTRDHSILAWGLGTDHRPSQAFNQAFDQEVPGRILAAAPSDFANSGNIVPRKQTTNFLYPIDITGGSLRASLPLAMTSKGKVIGFLDCGPENNTGLMIGIPLVKVPSGPLEEYFRPRGSILLLRPTSMKSRSNVYVNNHGRDEELSAGLNQHLWHYNARDFAKLHLEVIGVSPRRCWLEEQEAFTTTISPSDGPIWQTLVRLRHTGTTSRDFVIGLGSKPHRSRTKAQVCVFVCSRNTPLDELAANPDNMIRAADGKTTASNDLLYLHVALESETRQPNCTITLQARDVPPRITFDATLGLQASALKQVLVQILKDGQSGSGENTTLPCQAQGECESTKAAWNALVKKRQALFEEDDSTVWETKEWEHTCGQWMDVWEWWHKYWHRKYGPDPSIAQPTPFRWAIANDYADLAGLFLAKDPRMAATDQDGWIPMCCAATNGSSAVIKLLLEMEITDINTKDRNGQTPLISALSNDFLEVAELLLESGKADINATDDTRRTPLSWAAERGHVTMVKLLIANGAKVEIADNNNQTALTFARKGGHQSITRLLFGRGKWKLRCTFHNAENYRSIVPFSITFSPNSKQIAWTTDRMVQLWDTATGRLVRSFWRRDHHDTYTLTSFSPNSKLLAFAKTSYTIQIYDIETGLLQNSYTGYSVIRQMAFSPSSEQFAIESSHGTIKYWAEIKGNSRKTYSTNVFLRQSPAQFSADLKLFATAPISRRIEIRDVSTGQRQGTLKHHLLLYPIIKLSPNSRFLAATFSDRRGTALWDIEAGVLRHDMEAPANAKPELFFSPDSRLFGLISRARFAGDTIVKVWDIETGMETSGTTVPRRYGTVKVSPNLIQAVAYTNKDIRIWDTQTKQTQQVIESPGGDFRSVSYSPNSRLAAVAVSGNTIQLWDVLWLQ